MIVDSGEAEVAGKLDPSSPVLPKDTREAWVSAAGGAYRVLTKGGLLEQLGTLVRAVAGSAARALVVADANLPAELVARAEASLKSAGFGIASHSLRAGEEEKSFATVEGILSAAVRHRLERGEPFIALGGGLVGDLAGFAAATYRRGVPVVQCPTTLLAMVDAAIGGKTGVNLRVGSGAGDLKKNMAGSFHQPVLVVEDVHALRSLPNDEFVSGLAECVKHGLLGADFGDPDLYGWLGLNAAKILARDEGTLVALIGRNVAIKANCVSRDEREVSDAPNGGRMALNMGHTIGHAVETLPGLGGGAGGGMAKHGQAGALGLVAEAACGEKAGVTAARTAESIRQVLAGFGLPTRVRGLPETDAVIRLLGDDKKVAAGEVRMAVPTGEQSCRMLKNPSKAVLAAGIEAIRG